MEIVNTSSNVYHRNKTYWCTLGGKGWQLVLRCEISNVAGDQYNKGIGVRAKRVDLRYYMVRMKKAGEMVQMAVHVAII